MHVNESLQPYIPIVSTKTNYVSSTVILSRCNTSMKKSHLEYTSINSHCRMPISNPWSNYCKNYQNISSPILRNGASPNFDSELPKVSNSTCLSTSLIPFQCQNEFGAPNLSNELKVVSTSAEEELNEKAEHFILQCGAKKIAQVLEYNTKVPPNPNQNLSSAPLTDIATLKAHLKTSVISIEKPAPKRSISSFLIPIKERPTTTGFDTNVPRLTRSHTSCNKVSNPNQKCITHSSSLGNSEPRKPQSVINHDVIQKNNQLSLFQKPNNPKSLFISNSQAFLYPDPYGNESPALFMVRLSELAAFVNDTVKWEKSRNLRRRCPTQMQ